MYLGRKLAPKQAWDPQKKEHFPLPPVVLQLWPSSSALHHEHPPCPQVLSCPQMPSCLQHSCTPGCPHAHPSPS